MFPHIETVCIFTTALLSTIHIQDASTESLALKSADLYALLIHLLALHYLLPSALIRPLIHTMTLMLSLAQVTLWDLM